MSDYLLERQGETIAIKIGGHGEPETFTPAEAHDLVGRITDIADTIEAEARAIRERCEREGHLWGEALNGFGLGRREVHVRWCDRDGCEARQPGDGWVQA